MAEAKLRSDAELEMHKATLKEKVALLEEEVDRLTRERDIALKLIKDKEEESLQQDQNAVAEKNRAVAEHEQLVEARVNAEKEVIAMREEVNKRHIEVIKSYCIQR